MALGITWLTIFMTYVLYRRDVLVARRRCNVGAGSKGFVSASRNLSAHVNRHRLWRWR